LRRLLYFPAVVACQPNPHVKALYERLLSRGKAKMSAISAALRKMAHLCFGVIKTGKPYNPNWTPGA
jgi:transposase